MLTTEKRNAFWLSLIADCRAPFRKLQTAVPVYRLVPERVLYWIESLPRPSSASTGARISRISPTKSGLITMAGCCAGVETAVGGVGCGVFGFSWRGAAPCAAGSGLGAC